MEVIVLDQSPTSIEALLEEDARGVEFGRLVGSVGLGLFLCLWFGSFFLCFVFIVLFLSLYFCFVLLVSRVFWGLYANFCNHGFPPPQLSVVNKV